MLSSIAAGFASLLDIQAILAMVMGLAVGLSFGAMPGLNATIGITLLLPVTFTLNPGPAMLMLIGVYCGATFAGSISAILIKTPGTAAASATVLEGYPMTLKGKANTALNLALRGSVIGGVVSGLCLLFLAPQVAKLALKFGAPDYFMLAVFGLTIIASVSSANLLKGVVMAGLGLFVTCIGIDPLQGTYRLTFGSDILARGVDLVPALIGLFAVSELFNQIEKKVLVMEKGSRLGGKMLQAGAPDFKEDDLRLVAWYERQLHKLGVTVKLNTAVSCAADLEGYDQVILANGSDPIRIPLGDATPVVNVKDVMERPEAFSDPVCIVGGGLVGCEAALMLAQMGRQVSIVEALDEVMKLNGPTCYANRQMLLDLLRFHRIPIHVNARAKRTDADGLVVALGDGEGHVQAKTVALSIGFRADHALYDELLRAGCRVSIVGDAKDGNGNVLRSIWDAYEVAAHL